MRTLHDILREVSAIVDEDPNAMVEIRARDLQGLLEAVLTAEAEAVAASIPKNRKRGGQRKEGLQVHRYGGQLVRDVIKPYLRSKGVFKDVEEQALDEVVAFLKLNDFQKIHREQIRNEAKRSRRVLPQLRSSRRKK